MVRGERQKKNLFSTVIHTCVIRERRIVDETADVPSIVFIVCNVRLEHTTSFTTLLACEHVDNCAVLLFPMKMMHSTAPRPHVQIADSLVYFRFELLVTFSTERSRVFFHQTTITTKLNNVYVLLKRLSFGRRILPNIFFFYCFNTLEYHNLSSNNYFMLGSMNCLTSLSPS